jgi:hypothetical protein
LRVCVCVCVYEIQGYRTRKCYHSLPYSKSRTNFRLTVNVHNHCGTRLFGKWLDRAKKLNGNVLIAERELSAVSSRKSLDLGELKSALRVQFRHHRTMTRFYRSDSFCKHNLLLKSRQRRFVDKMAHRLVKVAEKHTHRKRKVTIAVGNCIDHPCSRGHRGGRLPNSKLVKALARIRRVVLIDEYNTTKRYVQKHSLILLTRIYQTQQLPQPGVFSVNLLRCISTGICHVESTSLLDTDEASRCSILLEHD